MYRIFVWPWRGNICKLRMVYRNIPFGGCMRKWSSHVVAGIRSLFENRWMGENVSSLPNCLALSSLLPPSSAWPHGSQRVMSSSAQRASRWSKSGWVDALSYESKSRKEWRNDSWGLIHPSGCRETVLLFLHSKSLMATLGHIHPECSFFRVSLYAVSFPSV